MTDEIRKRNAAELKRAWKKFLKEHDKNERQGNNQRNPQDAGQTAKQSADGDVQRVR